MEKLKYSENEKSEYKVLGVLQIPNITSKLYLKFSWPNTDFHIKQKISEKSEKLSWPLGPDCFDTFEPVSKVSILILVALFSIYKLFVHHMHADTTYLCGDSE